jgi:hypothetical protein
VGEIYGSHNVVDSSAGGGLPSLRLAKVIDAGDTFSAREWIAR